MATRSTHTYTDTLEIFAGGSAPDGGELRYTITFTYLPGSPAVMYQRNGDPGWPADPDEVEITNVTLDCAGAALECPEWLRERITSAVEATDALTLQAVGDLNEREDV